MVFIAIMDTAGIIILSLNLILGFSVAFFLSGYFAHINGLSAKRWQIYLVLLGVYLVESFAFSAGMATNFFSIILSIFWGLMIRSRVSKLSAIPPETIKATLFFSIYTSLPALSFISLPLIMVFPGWSVFSATSGMKFGIPGFLPWPMNTIFGFCFIVGFSALFLKTGITTGIVALKLRTKYQKRYN